MFVIKIEANYTKNLPAFIHALSQHFFFSLTDVMKSEALMFELMPESLFTMLLFSEIIEILVSIDDIPWLPTPASRLEIAEQALYQYTQGDNWHSLFNICVDSLMSSSRSNQDRETLWGASLKLFKSLEIIIETASAQQAQLPTNANDARIQEE
jgi:hypothetical protein